MKHLLTGGLALGLLIVSLIVAVFPWIPPDKFGIAGAILFVALIFWGGRRVWKRPRKAVWVLVLVSALSFPFIVIAQGFGGVDMMAFLFHLEFGMAGAGFEELHNEILTAGLALVWIILATWALSTVLNRHVGPYIAVIAVLLLTHPLAIFALTATVGPQNESDLAERLTLAPAWNGRVPEADLLVLYLEGLDEVYFEEEFFGDALKPLAQMKEDALNFTAVRQAEATGWSMAGIVASQCGIPLVPNGFRARNNFHGVEDYLGAHRCLGDVMKAAGYELEFIMGGDMKFAGYGTFLKQHGFDQQLGLKHFQQTYSEDLLKVANINWVLDDQLLFEEALNRHAGLLDSAEPFGLFVETITTHGDIAYASRECMKDGIAQQTRDVASVLVCFGEQVVGFLNDIKTQQGSRPLKIVILSDHLAHDERFKKLLPIEARANTVMMIDVDTNGQIIDKQGAMFDVYPTLLDWLQLSPEGTKTRAGLGVSLFSDAPTLVEEKGLLRLNQEIYINPSLGRAIWRDDSWAMP